MCWTSSLEDPDTYFWNLPATKIQICSSRLQDHEPPREQILEPYQQVSWKNWGGCHRSFCSRKNLHTAILKEIRNFGDFIKGLFQSVASWSISGVSQGHGWSNSLRGLAHGFEPLVALARTRSAGVKEMVWFSTRYSPVLSSSRIENGTFVRT